MTRPDQPPWGALIEQYRARLRPKMSARKAAALAGVSDSRWRQIVSGYISNGADQYSYVHGPADTVARMADVVGVSPEELADVGREDAADELRHLHEAGGTRSGVAPTGAEITAFRRRKGWDVDQLADFLNVGDEPVQRWEAGEPMPEAVARRLRAVIDETTSADALGSIPESVLLVELLRRARVREGNGAGSSHVG